MFIKYFIINWGNNILEVFENNNYVKYFYIASHKKVAAKVKLFFSKLNDKHSCNRTFNARDVYLIEFCKFNINSPKKT